MPEKSRASRSKADRRCQQQHLPSSCLAPAGAWQRHAAAAQHQTGHRPAAVHCLRLHNNSIRTERAAWIGRQRTRFAGPGQRKRKTPANNPSFTRLTRHCCNHASLIRHLEEAPRNSHRRSSQDEENPTCCASVAD